MGMMIVIGVRSAFMVLGCVMTAIVLYTVVTDGLPFRIELLTPWMAATLIDFYINILAIGAWIAYKESNWIHATIWIILLICFGSITTCGYIFLQFLKLSPQESSQDPIYFVLLKNRKKDGMESTIKLSVVGARVLFSILGCLMLGTLVYTIWKDGSPFRIELLTPWLSATLIDFYVNVFALSVWVTYKESNWKTAAFWIILLICFGSISTCAYIVLQLFHLSAKDPVYLVLFSYSSRADLFSESQRIKYTIETRTRDIPDARSYLLALKDIRVKRGLVDELDAEAMMMDALDRVEKESKKPLFRNDKKGMALLKTEFEKINQKLGIRKEDLPKYEEQLELKIAKAQLEELKKDAVEAMETQKKREEFKDEEMPYVKSLDIRNFI